MKPLIAAADPGLLAALNDLVGVTQVLSGEAVGPYSHDVFSERERPLAVVIPTSVEILQAVVRLAATHRLTLTVRGGGASYTEGYLPAQLGSLMLDLRQLKRIHEVNEEDGYVTVETGVTWAALKAELDSRGLRTPFRGPFSGLVATVGGTVAQNGISVGSGRYGTAAQSVLSLDVVMEDGRLLRTGTAARGSAPFSRSYGPDFTGLFTGDCGAFGIKARVTLPLLPATPEHVGVSFAFDSFETLYRGMRTAARVGVDDTHFGLDAALLRGQLKRGRTLKDTLDIARNVFATSPSWVAGCAQLLRMGLAGERSMKAAPYLAHYIIEGADRHSVHAAVHRLRQALNGIGREIANTVPAVIRSEPFAKMFNVVGPQGERWVPVHGVLANSRVLAFQRALESFIAQRQVDMQRLGVWTGTMYETVGPGQFMHETGIYWPDELSDYHHQALSPKQLQRLPVHIQNLEARTWVVQFKKDLVALYDRFGATHFQLGKAYPYAELLDPTALDVARSINAALDPDNRLNPGALGL
ncbi:FAD-binding oxidoreductase [Pseudomonas sp. TH10]|uniref:FAD-binding oxidoreductase n=1 Tax=Pseudomonas sp. TH10 TaxID=2796376 RepID=UPI001911A5AE|nr:FAD-binding oxidoreductase [Pseudomonas sp. TH10]MBK5518887.1 FAD-binding oxidoreductase [Pseudomonas sp. TH10]